MVAVKNFSSKDVDETAEKIYASVADKSLEEAYKVLIGYFADAKTKVIKQAILKVRLKVLLARIAALKTGIFDQKNIVLDELIAESSDENQKATSNPNQDVGREGEDLVTSEPSGAEGEDQFVTVSISKDVDILGTTFTKGMIVEVPAQQLSELIETGKAEVVEVHKTHDTAPGTVSEQDAQSDPEHQKTEGAATGLEIKEAKPVTEDGSADSADQETTLGSGETGVMETSNS